MIDKNLTVSVAITTFNRPDTLWECLQSLQEQSFKNFEIIIVNGGDIDTVKSVVAKFNHLAIKIIQQEKKGLVEARNLGWKEAKGEIVCMIDDDLVVSENWLIEILNTFSSDDSIGGVTGPTIISEERLCDRDAILIIKKLQEGSFFWRIIGRFYLGFILEGKVKEIGRILDCGTFTLGSNFKDCIEKDGLIEVDYLEACHMCLRRNLIEKVGGFDYLYTGTSEWCEPDLAFKIKKLGYKLVFNPKVITEHRVSKQGVFKARTYAFERSANFINFYFRQIRPNTLSKFFRFYSYLLFMNFYWLYKAITSRNMDWLSGVTGTASALINNTILKCRHKA